jgi:hypothetical protein
MSDIAKKLIELLESAKNDEKEKSCVADKITKNVMSYTADQVDALKNVNSEEKVNILLSVVTYYTVTMLAEVAKEHYIAKTEMYFEFMRHFNRLYNKVLEKYIEEDENDDE